MERALLVLLAVLVVLQVRSIRYIDAPRDVPRWDDARIDAWIDDVLAAGGLRRAERAFPAMERAGEPVLPPW
jgi:hypothetical protein